LYGAAEFKDNIVNRSASPVSLSKLAAIGLILSACTLGGCGRKGPLDLPPNAAMPAGSQVTTEQGGTQTYRSQNEGSNAADPGMFGGAADGNAQVVAPQGQKKRIPLDAILD
jgi:predicted small lipoprotein YifL